MNLINYGLITENRLRKEDLTMSCTFSNDLIEKTISFHGHSCPGLAIGIRAAELALRELGSRENLVAVVETDMCGVDAIQFLTGCTYGKGNLIHKDHGKMAFSFNDRTDGDYSINCRPCGLSLPRRACRTWCMPPDPGSPEAFVLPDPGRSPRVSSLPNPASACTRTCAGRHL